MLPRFSSGRLVLARRWFWRIRAGDVVVVHHQGIEKIKRVRDVNGQNVFLVGDNASSSTDSRQFGWVASRNIIGKVIYPSLKSESLR